MSRPLLWLRRVPPSFWPAVAALAVFFPVVTHPFVNWDDDYALLENFQFRSLSANFFRWAFTTSHVGEFRPFTWISFAVQYRLWRLAPGGYHLVSLLWHSAVAAAAVVVTLQVLRKAIPAFEETHRERLRYCAVFVVTVWAIHPLRVEPIAWISAQGLLPSAFFSLVAVSLYLRGHGAIHRDRWLAGAFVAFMIACLFRTSAATLPLLFVLLDRATLDTYALNARATRKAWLEKIPFFLVAATTAIAALWAKADAGAIRHEILAKELPGYLTRPAYSLLFPLLKTPLPYGLRAFYELPHDWMSTELLLAVLAVIGLTLETLRHRLWLATWIAYALILAPNLGFVPYGLYLTADRYSYVPLLALLPLATVALARFTLARRWRPALAIASITAIVFATAFLSHRQLRQWRDSIALWTAARDGGAAGVPLVRNNLGLAYLAAGRLPEARTELLAASKLAPTDAEVLDSLGRLALAEGQRKQAIESFEKALIYNPGMPRYQFDLAFALLAEGDREASQLLLEDGLQRDPGNPAAHRALASVLEGLGKKDSARQHEEEATRLSR